MPTSSATVNVTMCLLHYPHKLALTERCVTDFNGEWCIICGSSHKYHFCHNKFCHVFVMTKHVFCCNKSMFVAPKVLSRQISVTTNIILSRQNVCSNKNILSRQKDLSRQAYFCHDKRRIFSVSATKLLSRQKLYL